MLTRAIASPTPTVDTPTSRAARLDSESQGWIERLSPQSPQRDTAIAALHAHLLKAAAFKFALFEAGAKIRRRAWQGREVQMEPEGWSLLAHRGATPQEDVETAELLAALQDAVTAELTPHQREVLVAITLNDVPIDVLAERLNTTRGALYKTIHDARHKLRRALAARGLGAADTDDIS